MKIKYVALILYIGSALSLTAMDEVFLKIKKRYKLYEQLNVEPSASVEAIEQAYNHKWATYKECTQLRLNTLRDEVMRVHAAYVILSDERLRQKFNKFAATTTSEAPEFAEFMEVWVSEYEKARSICHELIDNALDESLFSERSKAHKRFKGALFLFGGLCLSVGIIAWRIAIHLSGSKPNSQSQR